MPINKRMIIGLVAAYTGVTAFAFFGYIYKEDMSFPACLFALCIIYGSIFLSIIPGFRISAAAMIAAASFVASFIISAFVNNSNLWPIALLFWLVMSLPIVGLFWLTTYLLKKAHKA